MDSRQLAQKLTEWFRQTDEPLTVFMSGQQHQRVALGGLAHLFPHLNVEVSPLLEKDSGLVIRSPRQPFGQLDPKNNALFNSLFGPVEEV